MTNGTGLKAARLIRAMAVVAVVCVLSQAGAVVVSLLSARIRGEAWSAGEYWRRHGTYAVVVGCAGCVLVAPIIAARLGSRGRSGCRK